MSQVQCWESFHCVPGHVLREHSEHVSPMPVSPCGVLGPALGECPMYIKLCQVRTQCMPSPEQVSTHGVPGTVLDEHPLCNRLCTKGLLNDCQVGTS